MDQDRLHPDAPRTVELVVRAVPDEHSFVRLDAERVAAGEVDTRVGLGHPDTRREDLRVEEPRQLRLLPQRLDVLGANGDQPDALPPLAQCAQRLDDAPARLQGLPDVLEPDRADLLQRLPRNPGSGEGRADRGRVAGGRAVPSFREAFIVDQRRHVGEHARGGVAVPLTYQKRTIHA